MWDQLKINGGAGMKKKLPLILILLCAVIAAAAVAAIFAQPYQPTSFVADGANWSAAVENGSELILSLNDTSAEWSVASSPECFASDYNSVTENGAEFHIIALDEGKGDMVFHSAKEDGSVEEHVLTLSISRHQKNLSSNRLCCFRQITGADSKATPGTARNSPRWHFCGK